MVSRWRLWWRRLRRNWVYIVGYATVVVLIIMISYMVVRVISGYADVTGSLSKELDDAYYHSKISYDEYLYDRVVLVNARTNIYLTFVMLSVILLQVLILMLQFIEKVMRGKGKV